MAALQGSVRASPLPLRGYGKKRRRTRAINLWDEYGGGASDTRRPARDENMILTTREKMVAPAREIAASRIIPLIVLYRLTSNRRSTALLRGRFSGSRFLSRRIASETRQEPVRTTTGRPAQKSRVARPAIVRPSHPPIPRHGKRNRQRRRHIAAPSAEVERPEPLRAASRHFVLLRCHSVDQSARPRLYSSKRKET